MDWIKVEKNTHEKKKMRDIAKLCGVSRSEAFMGWFTLWCWFDSETEDGFLPNLTPAECDEVSGIIGMGAALRKVEWVEFSDDGALIMKWSRHNGESAKKRALDAQRKADKRRGHH